MKKSEFNQTLKEATAEQLAEKLEELRKELFSLKLNASTAHVKDNSQFKKLRRNIARILTCMNQAN